MADSPRNSWGDLPDPWSRQSAVHPSGSVGYGAPDRPGRPAMLAATWAWVEAAVCVALAAAGGVLALVANSPSNRAGNELADIGVVAGAIVACVGLVFAVTFGAIAVGLWRERSYGAGWMVGVNAFGLLLGVFYVATSIVALGVILLAGPGVAAGWHVIARREPSGR